MCYSATTSATAFAISVLCSIYLIYSGNKTHIPSAGALSGHYVPTKWFAEGEQPEYNRKTSACKQAYVFLHLFG